MTMTGDAKKQLGDTIRGLRAYLLERLGDAARSEYQLDIADVRKTSLSVGRRARRERLEGLREGVGEVVKQAAYTLLNRLVLLKLLEGTGLRAVTIVTGGTESRAYRDFRKIAPAVVGVDDTEGYSVLLEMAYRELSEELPGLFGGAGAAAVVGLVPTPGYVLREVIRRLDARELESCWDDDMTLGWVYQYWNDPEREALDAKLNARGKLEGHEIASKTQMFTERYMVDWLLQNSVGPMWLAACRKHGWVADCERGGGGGGVEVDGSVLGRLEARRVEWRGRREAGAVGLTELMPLEGDDEARWAYYVPQPIPQDAIEHAPASVRDWRVLDPAVGSGHFLVVAFDLLLALHREEDRHRGVSRSDREIVEHILEHNLFGIDLDPRAVQIAAAALWLKAKRACAEARPKTLNLVSAKLRLGELAHDDAALVELREAVHAETGIPPALTDTIVNALKGADWIGSLLKVDDAVEKAIDRQGQLFAEHGGRDGKSVASAKEALLARLEAFLEGKTRGQDLGLRLRGEQLASGVRFLRMLREGQYDLVVGNPPYQGTSKMKETGYLTRHYPKGKADLYAMFLERGLQLVREGGINAMITMRNWMFIKQYAELRQSLMTGFYLRTLGDLSWGAFAEMRDNPVTMSVLQRIAPRDLISVGMAPTDPQERVRTAEELDRKRAATLAQVGRHDFRPTDLRVIPERPVLYWFEQPIIDYWRRFELLGQQAQIAPGVKTGDDTRFVRRVFEVARRELPVEEADPQSHWQFYVKGADGAEWFEPALLAIAWRHSAVELGVYGQYCASSTVRMREPWLYLKQGVAFSPIGSTFSARAHWAPSIPGNMGASVYSTDLGETTCMLNSSRARELVQALNPGLHFEMADVARLPAIRVDGAESIFATLSAAFAASESHREPSVEFRQPGPSPWRHAQEWAQLAVDRPEGAPLPPYTAELDPEAATDHVSYALGVVLGRFAPDGSGILDPRTSTLAHALPPSGLFLDGTLAPNEHRDGLGHPAAAPLHTAWTTHGPAIDPTTSLRDYLQDDFFATHRTMYDNRPIHWPLSSDKKTFVVWLNIHRMDGATLSHVLAEHLVPRQRELAGMLTDLIEAKAGGGGDKKAARAAEDRYAKLDVKVKELDRFIDVLRQLAERGPPAPDSKTTAREVDARYEPDLDDGVMINSAALWPVLEPQWKDPKKWWKELANSTGKKDYDWSHLAMRYWPTRVDEKCQGDPSLGVAHGSFWHYHPARAYAWELRLQDEIGPTFRIDEPPYRQGPGSNTLRERFIAEHPDDALNAIAKEAQRRRRKSKAPVATLPLLDPGLWRAVPGKVWHLELDLSEKQGQELRITAPDEPVARQTFEQQNPNLASERRRRLNDLHPATLDLDDPSADPDPSDPEEPDDE